jgi:hypothetical protein
VAHERTADTPAFARTGHPVRSHLEHVATPGCVLRIRRNTGSRQSGLPQSATVPERISETFQLAQASSAHFMPKTPVAAGPGYRAWLTPRFVRDRPTPDARRRSFECGYPIVTGLLLPRNCPAAKLGYP